MSDVSHLPAIPCHLQLHEAVINKDQKTLSGAYDIKLKDVLFITVLTLNNYLASTSLI